MFCEWVVIVENSSSVVAREASELSGICLKTNINPSSDHWDTDL